MEKNVVCYYRVSGKLKGVAQVTMTFGKWTQLLMLALLLIVVLFIFYHKRMSVSLEQKPEAKGDSPTANTSDDSPTSDGNSSGQPS